MVKVEETGLRASVILSKFASKLIAKLTFQGT
jgi:hypothetical protein